MINSILTRPYSYDMAISSPDMKLAKLFLVIQGSFSRMLCFWKKPEAMVSSLCHPTQRAPCLAWHRFI